MRLTYLALLGAAATGIAQAQLLRNGCFQDPYSADFASNGYVQHDAGTPTASIGAWTTISGSVDQISADSYWASVPECGCGVSLELNGVNAGAVRQTAFPLVAGTQYTLTWSVGRSDRLWQLLMRSLGLRRDGTAPPPPSLQPSRLLLAPRSSPYILWPNIHRRTPFTPQASARAHTPWVSATAGASRPTPSAGPATRIRIPCGSRRPTRSRRPARRPTSPSRPRTPPPATMAGR